MAGSADRAINMALRVLGIGEVERDFKRVGSAGEQSFAAIRKSANGAAQEVSDYTARLRRAVAEAKRLADATPQLNKPTATSRANRLDFIKGAVGAEQERMLKGLPDVTSGLGGADKAAEGFASKLGLVRLAGVGAGLALGALAVGAKQSLEAFEDHEKALRSFEAELGLAGNKTRVTTGEIEAMAKQIARTTTVSEAAALQGGQALAQVAGLSKEAFAHALEASARFAESAGRDLPDVISKITVPVLLALAEHDMPALIKASDGLSDSLKATIFQLAEGGKTAEAQQALFNGLTRAAGTGQDGLTTATDKLGKSWDRLKASLGEDIAKPVGSMLDWIAARIDGLAERIGKLHEKGQSLFGGGGMNFLNPNFITGGDTAPAPAAKGSGMGPLDKPRSLNDFSLAALTGGDPAKVVKAFEAKYAKTAKGTDTSAKVGDMRALIETLFPGATITSTTGGKHARGSDHYKGTAIDFVPKGGMGALSVDQVRAILTGAGADIRRNANGTEQLFGPGKSANKPGDHNDHFHVAFDSVPDSDRVRKSQADRAARAAEEALRHQREFDQRSAGLDEELLGVKRSGLVEASAIADAQREQVRAEQAKAVLDIEHKVQLGEYSQAQGELLKAKEAQLAAAKDGAIAEQEAARKAQEQLALDSSERAGRQEILGLKLDMARSSKDRRDLSLQMLENDKQEERAQIESILSSKAPDYQKKQAQLAKDGLNEKYALKAKQVMEQTQAPLDQYIATFAQNDSERNDKIENLIVGELEAVRTSIDSAINNALGIKDPLLAGLIDLLVQDVLIRPLADAVQKARGNASSGGGGLGGLFSGLVGSLFGGGLGSTASRLAPDVANTIAANPGLFASGTDSLPVGSAFYVGENGREKMRYHGGGRLEVISGARTHREAQQSGGATIVQHINVPPRIDPRRSAGSIARSTQGALARANRKGLAIVGGRND